MYIPDNYDAFRQHDAEQQRLLARLPKCSMCGERITDEQFYDIDGELFCLNCMEQNKVYTDNYIEE